MANIAFHCAWCGITSTTKVSAFNRAQRISAPLYCGRMCAGLGRRCGKTDAQKRAEKAEYDRRQRTDPVLKLRLKARRHADHLRNYDPSEAAIKRKARMPLHVEYCRKPEYKKYKQEYDRRYRARDYGPAAESYSILLELEREIRSRQSAYEINQANRTINKRQNRKREAARLVSCSA